ncbi:C-_U-editing enzyme APOBEC-1-like [Alligator mississippiensis]|uniref:C->U-editing enzyme APOBEC-1 n=1 Tax=Alligator mississippiensis TaxID=8496 RepID=A0A151P6H5_ALLMI|nr:C->U-editing enzyme APOBEC-1-like [Alligator mississippiensis]
MGEHWQYAGSGEYIPQDQFEENFDPSVLLSETHLLSELTWGGRPYKHWYENTEHCHAEIHFLENFSSKNGSCIITWYLSWSPCAECSARIADFMKENTNVKLNIHVARLYLHDDKHTRQGLRYLMKMKRVTIQIMTIPDYKYCWNTFLEDDGEDESDDYGGYAGVHEDEDESDDDDYLPTHFAPWIMLYSLELSCILQDFAPCLKIIQGNHMSPTFQLHVQDQEQKRLLEPANPWGAD